jgi:hypothetical protein
MSCNAMHPIQDLFLKSFSYVLQIDMHFICTPMWTKKFILVKSGCYRFPSWPSVNWHLAIRVFCVDFPGKKHEISQTRFDQGALDPV